MLFGSVQLFAGGFQLHATVTRGLPGALTGLLFEAYGRCDCLWLLSAVACFGATLMDGILEQVLEFVRGGAWLLSRPALSTAVASCD